ncbi:poly [ADP-ribose] polymerase 2 [Erpetoichthys calabaricus]|uniref:poly [ADP-ribose] polymerase 2 n=1 Tax=Erpetoichthys calabaricus TaxID=27687 RepID=UPI002234BDFF|nr:poly [ADP-ribose] polymerase 2 [Erpetoichthys calabaricus]
MSRRSSRSGSQAATVRAGQKRKIKKEDDEDVKPTLVVIKEEDDDDRSNSGMRWEWEGDEPGDWSVFSDHLNSQIADAFRSGKSSVSLTPDSGDGLKVDLKNMTQQNIQSGVKRKIRIAVRQHSKYFSWQWEESDGEWIPYEARTSLQLEQALQKNEISLTLALKRNQYIMDLVKMVQVNKKTKFERRIQRVESVAVIPISTSENGDGVTRVSVSDSSKNEEDDGPSPKKKKKVAGRSGKNRGVSTVPVSNTDKNEVVKKVVLKGRVPVDPECKTKVGKARVYCEGDDIYDVMLNQTNVQYNNNKYYLIQLLQDDSELVFSVWMRWGRVGKIGQSSLVTCGVDLLKAKNIFKKKFLDKTKNEWDNREHFEKVPGKYDIVKMDYSTNKEEESTTQEPKKYKDSKLKAQVQDLINLICNIQTMEECILEMKFDTQKAPLGKLTEEQIKAGYMSLKKIENCIKKNATGKELLEACNEFYTRIPHDFGLRTPPIIRTEKQLQEKIELLQALSDIEYAIKMVKSSLDSSENPLDIQYQSLKCSLEPLDHNSKEFKILERCLLSTHACTHSDYTLTLLDVFKMEKQGEKDAFQQDIGNRILLWHGSRLSNWVGILTKGLRVAPPEAPVTGYMFGKGIYFADMSSKSANYCFANRQKNVGLLLLSEVALGECNELLAADYDAASLPSGKHSTKGLGKRAPDPKNMVTLDEASLLMGPAINTGVGNPVGYSLLYNEYIVYNPQQVRMKYLLKVQFNFVSLW